jgi:hypothetical protein
MKKRHCCKCFSCQLHSWLGCCWGILFAIKQGEPCAFQIAAFVGLKRFEGSVYPETSSYSQFDLVFVRLDYPEVTYVLAKH